ncbi:MAG TPA: hypothetical protein PKG60_10085 [Spirochaetota bacterium]|nr:hypothetical protein [Spirochaetota bacterium]HPS87539.1 hypothetical protein [Spirochaetota bacterium]
MINDRFFIILLFIPCFLILQSCNPVSEDITDPLWNSLHNSKPFQSEFFHSADYRFPHKACDEPQCHGTSLAGGNSGAPSCYSCHDDQWTIFGVSHTKKISGYYHRYNIDDYPADRNSNALWFDSCKTCHGATLAGFQDVPAPGLAYRYSCKVCHSGFTRPIPPPGHRVNKSEEGKSGWHHYNYENADPEGGGNTSCSGTACHGDGTSGGSVADGSGGNIAAHGPPCSDCH